MIAIDPPVGFLNLALASKGPSTHDPRMLSPLPRWTGPVAFVGCFAKPCCLPRTPGGSASTTSFRGLLRLYTHYGPSIRSTARSGPSGPASPARGHALSQGFDPASYPTKPPASYRANRPLPGWDFHPRGYRAVRGAPEGHGVRTEFRGERISVDRARCIDMPFGRHARSMHRGFEPGMPSKSTPLNELRVFAARSRRQSSVGRTRGVGGGRLGRYGDFTRDARCPG